MKKNKHHKVGKKVVGYGRGNSGNKGGSRKILPVLWERAKEQSVNGSSGRKPGKRCFASPSSSGGAAKVEHRATGRVARPARSRPKRLGFAVRSWTAKRVAEVIKHQFGVSYHPGHCSRILQALKYNVQKPVQRPTQRDEAAIEHWKEERWPSLSKKGATNHCLVQSH